MGTDLNNTKLNGRYGNHVWYNGLLIREVAGREGRDGVNGASATRTWSVQNSDDPIVCRQALNDTPEITLNRYDGLAINDLSRKIDGPNGWLFTASYDSLTPEVAGYTVSIDTTGSQILQTNAYSQIAFPATGRTAIDYGTAIDVQNGRAQGVQRVAPAMKINVRARIATHWVGMPMVYAKLLASLTGTLNNAAIFDDGASGTIFEPGELLFIGASGEVVAEDPTLTFSFLASEDASNYTIGNIPGINKPGHSYIWFDFIDEEDTLSASPTTKPRAAYVGQIYGPADHSLMKIGEPAPPPPS